MSDQAVSNVSIVIPCYWLNQELIDETQACLDSLQDFSGEVILVDDASPHKTQPRGAYTLHTRETNGGYAAAVNTGLALAQGEYLVVSNDDIEFLQPDWLEHLLTPLDEGYAISSIRTSDADGYTVEERYEEDAKFGSIWAMKRSTYEQLGPLDESFGKGYFEDQDYWRRAKDAGLKVVKNHRGLVHHAGKATFKHIGEGPILHAMFKYKQKWGEKAHIYEPTPSVVVLVDDYELENPGYAYAVRTRELEMDEIKQRWPKYAD